jgi:hypothetical protein
MINITALIEELSNALHDNDVLSPNAMFSKDLLKEFIEDGVRYLSVLSPDICQKSVQMPLVSGSHQTLPDDLSKISSIEGVIKDGKIGSSPHKAERYFLDILPSDPCLELRNLDGYSISSYSFDKMHSPRSFVVAPPVPYGMEVIISIVAVVSPKSLIKGDNIDLDDWLHLPIYEYAMHRAFAYDSLSPNSTAMSSAHLAQATALLKKRDENANNQQNKS